MLIDVNRFFPSVRLRAHGAALFVVALGVSTRMLARSAELEGWDSADFALALERFDIALQRPHFPGYPVFIALARLLAPLSGEGAAGALTLTSALVAGLGAWAAHKLGGVGAAVLYVVAPGLWLLGGKPLSDGVGLSLLLLSFALAKQRPTIAGLVAGLVLGVRLSYAPALFGLVWLVRPRRRAAVGFALGGLSWLVPLIVVEGGPVRLLRIGLRFGQGHFERWGGAIGYLAPFDRIARQSFGLFDWCLGTLWPSDWGVGRIITTIGLCAALLKARRSPVLRAALLASLPYLIWVLVGQNPDRPRHLAPVAAAILIAAGAAPRACILAAFGMVLTAWPLVRLQATEPSPDTALVQYVAHRFPDARIYGWETTRLFDVYAPMVDAHRAISLPEVIRRERARAAPVVLFTSDLERKRRTRICFEHVVTFRSDRHVFPPRRGISLYRLCAPLQRR